MFDSGITLIVWLQQGSPAVDPFIKALTFLGDETFFLLSLPCIYWLLNKLASGVVWGRPGSFHV